MSAPSYGDSDNVLLRKIAENTEAGGGISPAVQAALDTKEDASSHSTLTRTSPVTSIDMAGDDYRTCTLDDDVAFTSENHAAARSVTVLLIAGGLSRALSFPAEWKFVGSAAPSTLDSGKEAVLTITAFGPDITDVRAAYAAEP